MSPLLQSKAYSMVCPQPGEADIRPDGADSRFDPTRTQADPVARPLSARADIRAQTATSGGDPIRTSATQFCCPAQRAWPCARLTPSPPGGLRETAGHSRPETCEETAATQADGTEAQQCGKGRASSQFNP